MKKRTWIYAAVGATAVLALVAWAFAPRPVEVEVASATSGPFETTIDEDAKTRLRDRYVVVVRAGHLLLAASPVSVSAQDLRQLEYVAIRSHSETGRILHQLGQDSRLELSSAHFLSLPAIIAHTDLAEVMPRAIALGSMDAGVHAVLPANLPRSAFTVSLHWSRRFESDPAHRWVRALFVRLFQRGIPRSLLDCHSAKCLHQSRRMPTSLMRAA